MRLVDQLSKETRVYATCPHCSEEFPVSKARLFSVKDPLPSYVLQRITDMRTAIKERRTQLRKAKELATVKAQKTAASVNLGKILEKIAPSFQGFAFDQKDCRALFEPIDYVVFDGLGNAGEVDALYFVDVKSGKAQLTSREKGIRTVIEAGRVGFSIVPENPAL